LLHDERVFLARVGGNVAVGEWQTLSLAAGFTACDATAQYRLTNEGRRVEFRGSVRRTNNQPFASTTTIATVPAEARPTAGIQRFTGQAQAGAGSVVGACRVEILPNGTMRVVTVDQPEWIAIHGYIWKD